MRDGQSESEEALWAVVERSLERKSVVVIPAEFAGRVTALAVAQRPIRHARLRAELPRGWGPRLAGLSCVVLAVMLFVLAPHVSASFGDLRFDVELLLLLELGGAGYLAVRPRLGE